MQILGKHVNEHQSLMQEFNNVLPLRYQIQPKVRISAI